MRTLTGRKPETTGTAAVDGEKAYNELLALYRQTDLSEEQRNVLRAIGSASTRDLLWRAME